MTERIQGSELEAYLNDPTPHTPMFPEQQPQRGLSTGDGRKDGERMARLSWGIAPSAPNGALSVFERGNRGGSDLRQQDYV